MVINVNIPTIAYPELSGNKVVPMGRRVYEDRVEERSDPWGRAYFWQGGVMVTDPEQPGTDIHAVSQGYVAITPLTLDWTDHSMLERLSQSQPSVKD
jgi:5'-nucleotidase